MDPFSAALDALFLSSGALDASYQDGSTAAVPIRVIRGRPDRDTPFGSNRSLQGTNTLEIRRSDVAQPVPGAVVTVGVDALQLLGDPILDVEGLTWTCGATPA